MLRRVNRCHRAAASRSVGEWVLPWPIYYLGHDELLEIDIIRQRHPPRVNAKDAPLGLGVGQRELDLAINAPGTDQGRVERLDAVGGHDDLPDWGSQASRR